MKRWLILMIIALAIVNVSFLLRYVIVNTDQCDVSCTNKGYSSGSCMSLSISHNPCENIGLVTDETYNLYCKEETKICCCEGD